MFKDKFSTHEYRDDIIKKFQEDAPIKDIREWLKGLGEQYVLSGDTLRRHKKRHLEHVAVEEEISKVKEEFGDSGSQIEEYLLETIAQCRNRKAISTISGKDFQYYDQQMQNAIKLLTELRGNKQGASMSLAEVFAKISEGILEDEQEEVTAGTDN